MNGQAITVMLTGTITLDVGHTRVRRRVMFKAWSDPDGADRYFELWVDTRTGGGDGDQSAGEAFLGDLVEALSDQVRNVLEQANDG